MKILYNNCSTKINTFSQVESLDQNHKGEIETMKLLETLPAKIQRRQKKKVDHISN